MKGTIIKLVLVSSIAFVLDQQLEHLHNTEWWETQNEHLLNAAPSICLDVQAIDKRLARDDEFDNALATYGNASQVVATTRLENPPLQPAPWFDLAENDVCYPIMKKFFALNECYRSIDGSACRSSGDEDDGNTITKNRTQPLYNFAFYFGQGLGRVIDHSGIHCIFATTLNRPCVIDLQPFDPYYTFRSFYQKNVYDWSPDLAQIEHGPSIAHAIGKLPSMNDNVWPKELVYKGIAPLSEVPNATRENANEILVPLYDARNTISPLHEKLLLSPSWAWAWHKKLNWRTLHKPCPPTDVQSLMMNAMYKPTDLAKVQFEKHRKNIWEAGQSFGAIQLRTHFIEKMGEKGIDDGGRDRIDKMQELVVDCMEKVPTVKQWWVLSDDESVAIQLAQRIGDDKLRHGYTKEFIQNNKHSVRAKNQPYLHKQLEPSVMDWMALYEADVSIVFQHGAFGQTGARGRNKVFRDEPSYKCGGGSMLIFRRRTPILNT